MPLPTSTPQQTPKSFCPTVATIDLGALAHNVARLREAIPRGCEVIAVVKADAYGHGMPEVARTLARLGIGRFAVANPTEGLALRQAGIEAPILVMGALFPEQIKDVIHFRLTPILHDAEVARTFADHLTPTDPPYSVHVKVDTGMGRLGLLPDATLELLRSPLFKGPLHAEGLMTHLSDADGQDPRYTDLQLERFATLVEEIRAAGVFIPLIHAANSAAILAHPGACFTAVRPGIMLYGYHTLPRVPAGAGADLKPVLTLSTRIAQVRSMAAGERISYNATYVTPTPRRIAVIPVGYADGYSRMLSNRGRVLIHGQEAPIVGRVCMDMTMVDVNAIPGARAGDPVVLIGRQGTKVLSALDLAAWQGTIPYEVLCGIGPRVRRLYTSHKGTDG